MENSSLIETEYNLIYYIIDWARKQIRALILIKESNLNVMESWIQFHQK